MRKDIFIDNCVACRFTNPLDPALKNLLNWLKDTQRKKEDLAYLAVSNKLLKEYFASCRGSTSENSIPIIVGKLQREGRLVEISNRQINDFMIRHFTNKIKKKLRSNVEDWNHIPVVLLSDRKFALTFDDNFAKDLCLFPGFKVVVSDRPDQIPYE